MRPEPFRDLDWAPDRARELGEAGVDLWVELLERMRELPAGRGTSAEEVSRAMALPVRQEPVPVAELVEHLRAMLFEYSSYPGHPGFMAYVSGAGTVPGAVGDLVAAGLNANVGGWVLSPAASELELHLMRLFCERFGYPQGSGGLMTSGGSASNFTALKAARDARAPWDVRTRGVSGAEMVMYVSSEAHATNQEAADLLGLGTEAVRAIPVDDRLRMRVDLLEAAIADDLAEGRRPFAVVASAGTTATGAIDPLPDIAGVAARHRLWLHVDAAYGGAAAFSDELRPLLDGIERADSITFDPHKWLYTPQSSACVLVRDLALLERSFNDGDVAYVREDRSLSQMGANIGMLGPQWSRSFMALKVWMSLAAHGLDAYGRRVAHDVELARYLHAEAERRPHLEPVGEVTLSIACFRYVPPGLADDDAREPYLNLLNERLMTALRTDGRAFPSNAVLDGCYVLRACIVNFRTEADDIDRMLDAATELGEQLDARLRPAPLPA
ncbi:MAG: aromatic-L-amino-acid/L-tryptophan decarboxylase [Gaiellales bacterium]|jgi:glutamate/tyrosine decarboxylase-like PLP-dependent enzyme|nr:aromatic-L-amino-acid/L-tryptophan decarboxylase [Gaiellales bacterium]